MSFDFCCDSWMISLEFDVSNIKVWIYLLCINSSGCWWCNDTGNIFLAYIRILGINKRLFKGRSLPRYSDWSRVSVYNYGSPFFWCPFPVEQHTVSQNQDNGRLVSMLEWPLRSGKKEIRALSVHPTNLELQNAIITAWHKCWEFI